MIGTNEQAYKQLEAYRALLNFPLIKNAAESVNSEQLAEKYRLLEEHEIELLKGIGRSLVPLMKSYPDVENSSFAALLPLVSATDELFSDISAFTDRCFSGKIAYDGQTRAFIDKVRQSRFAAAKHQYEAATGRTLGEGFLPVLKEVAYCQAKEKESITARLSALIAELGMQNAGAAADCIGKEAVQADDLPASVCVGAMEDMPPITPGELAEASVEELMARVGRRQLSVTPRENGNIVINVPQGSERDDALYAFISHTVLGYYDAFPIGTLRVHFTDPLMAPVFSKFVSGFQSGNANEKTRSAVELVPEYDEMAEQLENKCGDLMKSKLVGEIKDLYDLFKIDNTEPFDLVVIRNGFDGLAKNGRKNVFQSLARHFDHTSRGHRCGIRFILVNDAQLDDHRIDEETKKSIEHIVDDAEIVLDYRNGEFQCRNKAVVPLAVEPGYDEETFIETKCANIAAVLSKSANRAVTYRELGCFDAPSCPASAVLSIPVGKSGSEIVSIPFSCADIDNSDAAKNIGLMVLGQSGSGKSSLYHSIVINGSMKYSPEDLQFWLLDFKSNATVSMYLMGDIPHIRIVAPNSKKVDAYNIFRLLSEEMQSRLDLFNRIGQETGKKLNNVLEYNQFIEQEGSGRYKHLPRIILMIDEVQELFRDDGDTGDDLSRQIATYINKLVSLGRSSGIHMAMFAQNLDSQKTYLLKDAFINQVKCKVCFRLAPESVANSGFQGAFSERKNEMPLLETGVIYLAYSDAELQKCRVAYASGDALIRYLGAIADKYPSFPSNVLKIGVTDRLSAFDTVPNTDQKYADKVLAARVNDKEQIFCAIGEDAYELRPVHLVFDPNKQSSALLVGTSRPIAMSVFASLLMGLNGIECDIRVCGGRPRERSLYTALINSGKLRATKYNLLDIDRCIGDVYETYLSRKTSEERTGDCERRPVFLFLHDFDKQEKVKQNVEITEQDRTAAAEPEPFSDYEALRAAVLQKQTEQSAEPSREPAVTFRIRLIDAVGELLENAYQYGIYLVLLLNGDYYRAFDDALKGSGNVILFNDSKDYSIVEKYSVKTILQDIRQNKPARSINAAEYDGADDDETDNETFAVLARKDAYLKFRPVLYRESEEAGMIEMMEKEEDQD